MRNRYVIICARAGSKGIKNKNLKKIGKYTLVEKSIMIAKVVLMKIIKILTKYQKKCFMMT